MGRTQVRMMNYGPEQATPASMRRGTAQSSRASTKAESRCHCAALAVLGVRPEVAAHHTRIGGVGPVVEGEGHVVIGDAFAAMRAACSMSSQGGFDWTSPAVPRTSRKRPEEGGSSARTPRRGTRGMGTNRAIDGRGAGDPDGYPADSVGHRSWCLSAPRVLPPCKPAPLGEMARLLCSDRDQPTLVRWPSLSAV